MFSRSVLRVGVKLSRAQVLKLRSAAVYRSSSLQAAKPRSMDTLLPGSTPKKDIVDFSSTIATNLSSIFAKSLSSFAAAGVGTEGSSEGDSDDIEPRIPPYEPRPGEPAEVKRARLLYQSRKRGMLENGLLLSTFASIYLKDMTESHLDQYDYIINNPSNDWKLYYWITGHEETPVNYDLEVMNMIKMHARNDQMETRCRQPDL